MYKKKYSDMTKKNFSGFASMIVLFLLFTFAAPLFGQTSSSSSNSNSMSAEQLSLSGMKTISVTIGGNAPVIGTFVSFPFERVDQFITRIFERAPQSYATRNITLQRSNGEKIPIDLQKFHYTGDFHYNPTLKNEDFIFFPWLNLEFDAFNITGAVKLQGRYQFVEGDHLADAINLAGGFNPAYENVHLAEISRLSYDGLKEELLTVEISSNPEIKRGDRIRVLADESYRRYFGTYVFGEVLRPGFIPMTREDYSLAKVLEKAGGFTENADREKAIVYNSSDLSAIYIDRQYNIGLDQGGQIQKLQSGILDQINHLENGLFLRMSNLAEEDTGYFAIETRLRTLFSQSRINIQNYKDTNSYAAHYYVHQGDYVYIPPKEKYIHVFGQVSKPGDVLFIEGKDYAYYVDQCGGFSELAKKSPMVITGDTKEWISLDDKNKHVTIHPGDYIFVPKTAVHSFPYYVDLASKYSTIVGAIATTVLLIVQITKK
jgi:protein involved in polysaccharide export with SLBB domain